MKYTPGPWRVLPGAELIGYSDVVGPEHKNDEDCQWIATVDCQWIATVHGGHLADFYGGANARLIAAAPELLEALEDADGVEDVWLAEWQRRLGSDAELSHEAQVKLHQLRQSRYAIIAKARGES